MRKNIVCLILGTALLGATLAGCGNEDATSATSASSTTSTTSATSATSATSQSEGESGTQTTETEGEAVPGESIQTNGGEVISLASLEHQDATSDTVVYFTSDISPEAMVAAYDALGTGLTGENIAVKLSTGEPPASNYLDRSDSR